MHPSSYRYKSKEMYDVGNVRMFNTIPDATEGLSEYVNTYPNQEVYESYDPQTYLDDMLYGIAISMSDKYRFVDGFSRFREELRLYLAGERKVGWDENPHEV